MVTVVHLQNTEVPVVMDKDVVVVGGGPAEEAVKRSKEPQQAMELWGGVTF